MDINSLTPLVSTPAKNITPIHSFSTGSRTHFVSSTISLLNIFILMFFLYCTFWGAEPHLRKSLMLSSSQRSPVECISECHRLMPHLWVLLHWLENTVLHIRCHVRHYFPTTIHHSTPSVIKNNMRKLQEAVSSKGLYSISLVMASLTSDWIDAQVDCQSYMIHGIQKHWAIPCSHYCKS